ncbi:unnamed protein product [Angiostrongylus costaricensis]|uniref:Uncharacterized protein n=1 Tax=Angiostrongylus costaricensis TaxID=334426 RepID=A0A0R3PZV6_ANGCS|nr:unnamed protein product [Angiostrongylus costaricensis]
MNSSSVYSVRDWQTTREYTHPPRSSKPQQAIRGYQEAKQSKASEAHSAHHEGVSDAAALDRASTKRVLKLQGYSGLSESQITELTICTYIAHSLTSDGSIKELIMQARRIRYDVIEMEKTGKRQSLNSIYNTAKELFLRTPDNRGVGDVGGVGVFVNTSLSMNIDSFE